MNRCTPRTVLTAAVAAIGLLAAANATADDKDLLRSATAPPNVLVLLDSAATMVQDPETNNIKYMDCGDDPGSKLYQAKDVMKWFVDAMPDFNMGFSYFEKSYDDLTVHYLNYLYRTVSTVDQTGAAQATMLDGTPVGGLMRMGAKDDVWHSASPIYPIHFGLRGEVVEEMCFRGVGATTTTLDCGTRTLQVGDVKRLTYLATGPGGGAKGTGEPFYYPSYDWSATGSLYQDAFANGDWSTVASALGVDTSTDAGKKQLHDALVQAGDADHPWRRGVLKPEVAPLIGTEESQMTLYVREDEYVAATVGRSVEWPASVTRYRVTTVDWVNTFVLYDRPNSDPENGSISASHDTLTSVDWHSPGNDCLGYVDRTSNNIPIVPIQQPDPATGVVDSASAQAHREYLKSFLEPQPSPIFYFPTRSGAASSDNYYLPNTGAPTWMPFTNNDIAGGRRPIKRAITEINKYIVNVVRAWPDPLRDCRKDFVILITDGLETCDAPNTLCVHARNFLGRDNIPAFVIGFGPDVFSAEDSFKCIATESGGAWFLASNKEALRAALLEIGRIIKERLAAFASPAVPSVELTTREKGYISTFFSVKDRSIWEGHLRAYLVDPVTGLVPTTCQTTATGTLCFPDTTRALWDAGTDLATRAWTDRKLFYSLNRSGGGVPGARLDFVKPSNGSAEERALWNLIIPEAPVGASDTLSVAQSSRLNGIVNFLRGDRASIDHNGNGVPDYRYPFDTQLPQTGICKLGDIFHSVPAISGRPDCFACFQQDYNGYRNYWSDNQWRRKVLVVGSNDSQVHAFEAGLPTTDAQGNLIYDNGDGTELFAWVPTYQMPILDDLAESTQDLYGVDGTATIVDAFMDANNTGTPAAANRQWHTVALVGERSGGRSLVALDVTRPDTYTSDHVPVSGAGRMPGCLTGASTAGCLGNYPNLLWEFQDPDGSDADTDTDLGETWSRPSVGLVKVRPSGGDPETRYTVIFGGGYRRSTDAANYLYMVDIETGKAIMKMAVPAMVPGEIGLLDNDFDGYLERIYWTDTAGNVWRMKMTGGDGAVVAANLDATSGQVACSFSDVNTASCSGWNVKKVFTPGAAAGYQPIFHRPAIVLAGFNPDGTPLYAIGAGSGDRENILSSNTTPHRFYFFLDPDVDSSLPWTEANLQAVSASGGTVDAQTNYLFEESVHGWYLTLGDREKVNTPAVVISDQVIFSTFTPSTEWEIHREGSDTTCWRRGDAKTYVVDYTNANPAAGQTARFTQFRSDVLMVSEPIIYVGEDGKLHVLQSTDNLAVSEPVIPEAVRGLMVSWREREL